MGESLLTRSIGSASGGSGYVFITEIITEDKTWVAPDAQNQQFSVRIFGGGGGYGPGGSLNNTIPGLGGGGSGFNSSLFNNLSAKYSIGGSGVCIIQYYI